MSVFTQTASVSTASASSRREPEAHLEYKPLLVVLDVEDALHAVDVLPPQFQQCPNPQIELLEVHLPFDNKTGAGHAVIVDVLVVHVFVVVLPVCMLVAVVMVVRVAVM